ncbi:MAG: sigma-70 family RNA polymerase sigma factor [Bacilli bacterium]|jgi:RNA polymerase sigma-70 factor (ECF subfamily)|nr:sigma-70 family RNA polymerase sigma factor [Bacilli bacterium]MCH4228944.1 sigma-70 family RNA polymerase sigma factor [Bacilli bacterium]MCI2054992.1 sigma-70 family RNA polymerase sigma factor [Bacilli bacterium]
MKLENLSDYALLKKISHGSEAAFEVLYHRYFKILFSTSDYYLNDEGEAKETVQALFASIWANPESFKTDSEHSLHSFLSASIRNSCFSSYKKMKREILVDDENIVPSEDKYSALSIEDACSMIRKSLSKSEANIVILHIFGELNFKEIAECTMISENSASSSYTRAIGKLRKDNAFMSYLNDSVVAKDVM